jgi:hypothetical protein
MDWDKIADQLKGSFDEDTVKNLIDALKQAAATGKPDAAGGLSPEEIAALLGRVLGKFGAGAVGGATGLDPDLIKFLLELFGPLAVDTLAALIKRVLGGGGRYVTEDLGDDKYSQIVRDPPGITNTEESFAPDINVLKTASFECHNGMVRISFTTEVTCREEKIAYVKAVGRGVAGGVTYIETVRQGQKTLPKKGDQSVDDAYEVVVEIDIPCTALFTNGGVMLFTISVYDEDDNRTIQFVEADTADFLLKDACCKTPIDDILRARLLEIIRTGMKPLTREDLEKLIQLVVKPKTEERSTPSAPPPETPPVTPKAPTPKVPGKKAGAGVRLGDLLVEIPIDDIEVFEVGPVVEAPVETPRPTRPPR